MSAMLSEPVAQERLASVSEMLSARTRAAYAAAVRRAGTGVAGTGAAGAGRGGARRRATIVGMRQMAMVNFDLLMEFELTVLPDGAPAYPAVTQQLVSPWQARQLGPGLTLEACADPSDPAAVWLWLDHLASGPLQ